MLGGARGEGKTTPKYELKTVRLPEPRTDSKTSLEKALLMRRSVREFKKQPLTVAEVSQLLWAVQGITEPGQDFRAAPSAGALYPLEVYVAVGHVDGVSSGVYKYRPHGHELVRIVDGDVRGELVRAALDQTWMADAGVILVIAAVYDRTLGKYHGERGRRYVHIEVGHAAENVCLQAVSLRLGTTVVGAFHDDGIAEVMRLSAEEKPLCIMPVGRT